MAEDVVRDAFLGSARAKPRPLDNGKLNGQGQPGAVTALAALPTIGSEPYGLAVSASRVLSRAGPESFLGAVAEQAVAVDGVPGAPPGAGAG
jgi:hypothetical protein